jgi:hypothetical protein
MVPPPPHQWPAGHGQATDDDLAPLRYDDGAEVKVQIVQFHF